MSKLNIKICTGTLCYVMGGADLLLLEDNLTPEQLERVNIQGSPCLDFCNKADAPKAPFVMVGDRVVSEANVSKVVDIIEQELSR